VHPHGPASAGDAAHLFLSHSMSTPRDATIVWPARVDAPKGTSCRSLRTLQGKNHVSLPAAHSRPRTGVPQDARGSCARPPSHTMRASRGSYPGTSLNLRVTSHSELLFSLGYTLIPVPLNTYAPCSKVRGEVVGCRCRMHSYLLDLVLEITATFSRMTGSSSAAARHRNPLHHCPNPAAALDEMTRVSREDRRIIIVGAPRLADDGCDRPPGPALAVWPSYWPG
jgi:hypothetical protein